MNGMGRWWGCARRLLSLFVYIVLVALSWTSGLYKSDSTASTEKKNTVPSKTA
jgi:hypothetical protein